MSKRPAFQFYPGDWRNDPGLRLCSIGARGLWIDMLCLMHEGEPYGHLTVFERAMPPEALAKLVGESPAAVKRWIVELEANNVLSRAGDDVIYSRRMVRDEHLREVRAAGGQAGAEHGSKGGPHGSKGGRPRKDKGGSEGDERGDKKPPLEPPPSSSSSSPPSSKEGSEDKSSDGQAVVLDFDADAWTAGVNLLTGAGVPEKAARSFFGKLLSANGLQARDLLALVTAARVNNTLDPQSYLTKGADNIAKRRAPAQPKRVGFV